MKKVALHNLGCKVNTYETDAMAQSLREKGYEIMPFEEGADIYIINTCSVTNIADRKSRQMLHRAKKLNPNAIVVATGCYVQTAGKEALEEQNIDLVIGNNNKSHIVDILEEYIKSNKKQIVIDDLSRETKYEDMNMTTVTEHTRAFIKIQDGCNQFCTYCIIPYARGRIRSRDLQDMIREIKELAHNGFKEIVLTGIHLSSYGKEKDLQEKKITLIDAIRETANIEGIERVRLGSLEPMIITEDFLKQLRDIKEFCPHFHLSLQSGCEATLKRMNRHYTPDMYYERCKMIREYFDNPAITTDVIVGFPGESDEDFEKCKSFLRKVCFSEMHIFKYSKRHGTIAAKMENQIDDNKKSIRSDILLELNEIMNLEYRNSFIGKNAEVLLEEKIYYKNKEYQVGYTKEYVKIGIISEKDLTGKIVNVSVIENIGEILLAQI
ncbi:MAG: tRNA (N(6)-L-threonylcarbamoyladenosine(37)-C(2))-methylthiotransferase MtaB [Lachnospiraceae bacterium]|nr:tRNA (N(6)-L-threonylcarbamoyladenosine(37)-C(2))-methylthiotransferase MtaB [Lachnospiraceae bacterium]